MVRSSVVTAGMVGALLGWSAPGFAQTSDTTLAAAERLVAARQYDSAVTLLNQVIERDPAARLSAYVWLGIAHHFAGSDSLARAAFRRAFTLDSGVVLEGVGDLDPERLPQLLAEERVAARAARPAAVTPADATPEARCLPACVGLVRPPEFVSIPRVSFPDHLRDAAAALNLVVRLIVDTAGRVEPRSVEIVRSNVGMMDGEIRAALAEAHFRPGRTSQGVTRTQVELTFQARAQGATISGGRTVRSFVLGRPLPLR